MHSLRRALRFLEPGTAPATVCTSRESLNALGPWIAHRIPLFDERASLYYGNIYYGVDVRLVALCAAFAASFVFAREINIEDTHKDLRIDNELVAFVQLVARKCPQLRRLILPYGQPVMQRSTATSTTDSAGAHEEDILRALGSMPLLEELQLPASMSAWGFFSCDEHYELLAAGGASLLRDISASYHDENVSKARAMQKTRTELRLFPRLGRTALHYMLNQEEKIALLREACGDKCLVDTLSVGSTHADSTLTAETCGELLRAIADKLPRLADLTYMIRFPHTAEMFDELSGLECIQNMSITSGLASGEAFSALVQPHSQRLKSFKFTFCERQSAPVMPATLLEPLRLCSRLERLELSELVGPANTVEDFEFLGDLVQLRCLRLSSVAQVSAKSLKRAAEKPGAFARLEMLLLLNLLFVSDDHAAAANDEDSLRDFFRALWRHRRLETLVMHGEPPTVLPPTSAFVGLRQLRRTMTTLKLQTPKMVWLLPDDTFFEEVGQLENLRDLEVHSSSHGDPTMPLDLSSWADKLRSLSSLRDLCINHPQCKDSHLFPLLANSQAGIGQCLQFLRLGSSTSGMPIELVAPIATKCKVFANFSVARGEEGGHDEAKLEELKQQFPGRRILFMPRPGFGFYF